MEKAPLLGIFDSGVGGFSVYRKIREASTVNCIYYGDCARAPYGNKTDSEIVGYINDDIQFLLDEDVTYFVNACNSMSVITTDAILNKHGISSDRYTDMIRAFSKHFRIQPGEIILVIATVATLRSRVYQDFLLTQGAVVFEYAFENLARMIEENEKKEVVLETITPAIAFACEVGATKIVYGCTHYPLINNLFVEVSDSLSWEGKFVDPAECVAKEVLSFGVSGERAFTPYSSKDTPAFIKNVVSVFSM